MTPNPIIDKLALDAIVEERESFEIETKEGKETLYLYPLQLGRLALISKRLLDLDITLDKLGEDADKDPLKTLWTVCSEKPQQVAEIIAIATLRTKDEIDEKFKERTEQILWSPTMTTDALTTILSIIIGSGDASAFMYAIRLLKTLRVNISQNAPMNRIATAGEASGGF